MSGSTSVVKIRLKKPASTNIATVLRDKVNLANEKSPWVVASRIVGGVAKGCMFCAIAWHDFSAVYSQLANISYKQLLQHIVDNSGLPLISKSSLFYWLFFSAVTHGVNALDTA